MKKQHISIVISIIGIISTIVQNYRLAEMYNKATGKIKALFGIIELAQVDIKVYIGIGLIISSILGILALRRKENKTMSIVAIVISVLAFILLFARLWTCLI